MTKRFPLFLEKYTPPTTIFLSAVLILAMLCSKLLLSMATFGLVFLGLGYAAAFPERLKAIRTRYDVLLPILFWFFMVITGFYSRNTQDWLWQIRLMLPYFGLPFVLFLLPAISLKAYKYLHYWLLFLVAIVCITMNIDYALHAADWIVALGKGQSIDPMLLWIKPIDHIRFSLLLAFSALASAYFFIENSETPRFERVLMAISFILNTETLHLLTVRIGLLAFYAIAIAGLFILIIRKKKWLLGTTILAGIVALPFFAMKIMPNLYTKFYYSYWDLLQYKNGTLTETSDVGRLNSIVSGIYIGNSSPIIGVGYGDILAESGYQYAVHFPTIKQPLPPHNQFIHDYAGGGIIGVILLLAAFFVPLFYYKKNTLFTLIWSIVFLSYLTESTLSTALGVALVGFFMGLATNVFGNSMEIR